MNLMDRIKIIEECGGLSTQEIMDLRNNPLLFFDNSYKEFEKEYNDADLDMKTQLSVDYGELYAMYLGYKNNRTNSEEEYLRKFKQVFLNELSNNKTSYITSRLISDEVVNKMFNDKEKDIIERYKRDVKAAVITIFGKLKNGQVISKKEEAIFYKFIGRPDLDKSEKVKEMREFVLRDNIEHNKKYSTFEKQFLCRHLAAKKCKEKGMPVIVPYLTSTDLSGKKVTSWAGLHTGLSTGSIIQISQDHARQQNFIETEKHGLAHVVLHEYEHWYQHFNTKNNLLNPTTYIYAKSMVLRLGLSKSGFDEYMNNYVYKETERFANIRAFNETARLISDLYKRNSLSNSLGQKAFELRASLTRGVQMDENGEMFYIGDFNVEQTEKVLKANPKYLQRYPILSNFYNKDGSLRNLQSLVSIYTTYSINKNYDAIDTFDEVLEYHILHGNLKTVNFNTMDPEDVLSLLIIMQKCLEKQIRACKDMLDSYPDIEIKQHEKESDEQFKKRQERVYKQAQLTNYLFKRRTEVIKTLLSFAYTNKDSIDKYCEWNANRRLKGDPKGRMTMFNTTFYGYNGIETIRTRIKDNPNVVKAGLQEDIEDISRFVPKGK